MELEKTVSSLVFRLTGKREDPTNINHESKVMAYIDVKLDALGRLSEVTYYNTFNA